MNLLTLYENSTYASMLHSRYYVEGALFGAGVTPEIPMPDVWLPWAIKNQGQLKNNDHADMITDALFDYFKHCLQQMKNDESCLPAYCVFDNNLQRNTPISQWMEGLLMAHSKMETVWHRAWTLMQAKDEEQAPKLAKKLKHSLGMFSTFANIPLALQQASVRGQKDFKEKLPLISASLPQALQTYVRLSGELASYLPNQFESFVQKPH